MSRTTNSKKDCAPTYVKKLAFRYGARQVVPYPVVETGQCESSDGVLCDVIAKAALSEGSEKERLECECQSLYGMSFERVRNIWVGRLNRTDLDVWYIVEMK